MKAMLTWVPASVMLFISWTLAPADDSTPSNSRPRSSVATGMTDWLHGPVARQKPALLAVGNERTNQPVEIGTVKWSRDFDGALARSQTTGKPLFVLFQEVPGCSGCQKFGREVLSDPLLVEAIENEFLPVVVFNNRSTGSDALLLKRYREPSWNYQVVRFLDGKGKDVIPRKDHIWTLPAVAKRMIDALEKVDRKVPNYLKTLADNARATDEVAFAMSCFWTGEFELGSIPGVMETEAGWLDGREVTLVRYDRDEITLAELVERATNVRCAQKVYTAKGVPVGRLKTGVLDSSYRRAQDADQKRQLASVMSRLNRVPSLNKMQLTKLNALMPRDTQSAMEWLSPQQREAFLSNAP